MDEDTTTRFNLGADAWADYNQRPLGCIRREVTWHNLAPYLPGVAGSDRAPRMLDAGGGTGELALRLVEQGYRVWLLEPAPAMLDRARQAARDLPDEARARLTCCQMAVEDAPRAFDPGFFDAITCHTLIEFLPDPPLTLHALTGLLGDGGMLSVSFANRHTLVLRQVWSQLDPAGALLNLDDSTFCASLFELPGRAYTAKEVSGWLADLGLAEIATCGVRVFADYLPRERLDDIDFFDALLRLELAVAVRTPYNLLGRYVHLLAHKSAEP
jgi:S-adenosylmethionine-dependent methyltransferase